jgi:ABC-type enterochelin transport system ATPase subunit
LSHKFFLLIGSARFTPYDADVVKIRDVDTVKPPQNGPGDAVFPDLETHNETVIVELLTVDNLTAHGRLPAHRGDLANKKPSQTSATAFG